MNFTQLLILNSLLLASVAAPSPGGRDETQQPSFQASVSPAEAQFVVPISPRDTWEWQRNAIKDRRREYSIEVTVGNDGKYYRFGFYLFKKPGSTPKSGDLAALLKAGQQSLFLRESTGRYRRVKDAGITVRPEKDLIIIAVQGKQNIDRLFSSRPEKVRFAIAMPGEPAVSESVIVSYADR